ncbi:hypothetical protein F5884DRAFT_856393 [Xylogone sp. PMI_703]|nr:hypothetical protein F5884DRAFT_856393 [Xylogone sp. PMI_703]
MKLEDCGKLLTCEDLQKIEDTITLLQKVFMIEDERSPFLQRAKEDYSHPFSKLAEAFSLTHDDELKSATARELIEIEHAVMACKWITKWSITPIITVTEYSSHGQISYKDVEHLKSNSEDVKKFGAFIRFALIKLRLWGINELVMERGPTTLWPATATTTATESFYDNDEDIRQLGKSIVGDICVVCRNNWRTTGGSHGKHHFLRAKDLQVVTGHWFTSRILLSQG